MNAQDLKNSILQLAIQGKLVEQRKEEGTSKELLKKLKTSKNNLVKEKKIYSKKETEPFYKNEDLPFDIPDTWEWVKLSDVSIIQEGAGIRKYQYKDSGVQLFSVTNILEGSIDLDKKQLYVSCKEFQEKYTHLQLNDGDIVTACSGGSWGKVAIYDKKDIAMLNTSTLRLRFFEDIGNNYFIYYVAQSTFFKRQLQSQLVGMQPNFGYAHYSRICLPMPPLEEQKRIVAKIEELLPYIERYGEAYSKVKGLNKKFPDDMQKSILQYAMQGKLVEQRAEEGTAEELLKQIQEEKAKLIKEGIIKKEKPMAEVTEDEMPFEIPESWKWVRLAEITHNWGQKRPDKAFDYIDVASVDNINGCLSELENLIQPSEAPSRARKIVKKRTVIYSTVRPYLLNICIVDKEFEHEPIASTAFAVLHPQSGISEKYLYFVLRSPMFISYVSSVMIGVAYPAINDANLLSGLIPLPPLEEQKRIVAKIEEMLPYCKQLIK